MRKIGPWLAVAVLACVAGWFWGEQRHQPAPLAQADQAVAQVFQLTLPDSAGQNIALQTYQGKTVVLNFWAPWCPPCVEEMPELEALHQAFAAKNVQFVGIGIDSAKNIQQFTTKTKVSYPLLVASYEGTQLAKTLGNAQGGLPFTVIISADGRILQRKTGKISTPELQAWLQAALANKP